MHEKKFPSLRFSYDGEDYFAHEKANHTVHRSHGYLHDIAYCVIQGVCDISCKENKLFTKTAWLLYFYCRVVVVVLLFL